MSDVKNSTDIYTFQDQDEARDVVPKVLKLALYKTVPSMTKEQIMYW